MVSFALRAAAGLIDEIRQREPQYLETINSELGFQEEELHNFLSVADTLRIPEGTGGLIWQCDDFDKFENLDFDRVWKDRTKAFGSCISQERNYRSKALKQADVLMLFHLFPKIFDGERAKVNFDYYYPITTHDSSLSCCVHSILAARLGRRELAWELFGRTLGLDLEPDKGGAAEGIHIANCGGIWQSVIAGFAGAGWAYDSDKPCFEPRLPDGWKRLKFKYRFKGSVYDVSLTGDAVNCEICREEESNGVESSNL
jgi:kojibiose phosphorylase